MNKGSCKRAVGMVRVPENRSQGRWLKELRQFGLEEKKARGAGCKRLLCGRRSP